MSILVKDLPIELRELANKRRLEFYGSINENMNLYNYFTFSATLEGAKFWLDLHEGKDVRHYLCYPKLKVNYYFY